MSPFFLVAFALCFLLDLFVALTVLRRRTRHGLRTLRQLWLCALAMGALLTVQALVLLPFGLHAFGVLHLVWIVVAYVAPLAGAVVLLDHRRGLGASGGLRLVALLALLSTPLVVFAQLVTPFALQLETAEVRLSTERTGELPLRVAVLADLQTPSVGQHERDAIALLMAQKPDLILIPGDIFQGSEERFADVVEDFEALLGQLEAPGGVWIAPGNTDYQDGLDRLARAAGTQLLRDEIVRVELRDRVVKILGVNEGGRSNAVRRALSEETIRAFEQEDEEGAIRIVLAHRPSFVSALPANSRIDLVVSGHTHGGQVAIPGFGPPLTLSPLPREIGAGGLHAVDGNPLYVSRGVGMERQNAPRIRLGVTPEISLLTLADESR